jgi:hypothetical protein
MNYINKIELQLKLDKFEKCYAVCDQDCPLGQLYDYATYLQSFVLERMKQANAKQEEKSPDIQPEAIEA